MPWPAMMRRVFTDHALLTTFDGLPNPVLTEYQDFMGITVNVHGHTAGVFFQLAILAACGIMALIISAVILKRRYQCQR